MSLPDDYLKALGRISVNFAHLEFEMLFLIWPLLDSDQDAARIVADALSFKQKCDLIESLCELRISDKEEKKELGNLVKELDRARTERNRLIHSVWATDGAGTRVFSQGKKVVTDVTLKDLKALGDFITNTSRHVTQFTSGLRVRFPGLLETRRNPYENVKR